MINALFLSSDFIQSFVKNPSEYVKGGFLNFDLQFSIVFIGLIIIIVLISYIFYLILTFNSRSELVVWEKTKSLALSKGQFMRLYESAPVPYVMLNKNGEIYEPNKATLRFFGVVPEEIEGKNLFSFASEEDKELAEKFFHYYKSNLPIERKEIQMVTKNGEVKSVLLSIFEMKNLENGKSMGMAIIFDVTEQKLLDKAKTEFVSLASHQLKTPLATTKWYTEMLTSGDLGELLPKQKEYIDRLHAANDNMIELVDVLLNVSRIEMGSLAVEVKPTNVEELSESVLLELNPLIEKKRINIIKKYNNCLTNVKSDPKLLRIVIQNLISNAVKYTPEDGTINIDFEETPNERKIIVSDTGVGIPKGDQGKIFTKLFRSDNVKILPNSQGTGLGLYLVKSMIEGLGGNISFVSEENKGSTFTIKF